MFKLYKHTEAIKKRSCLPTDYRHLKSIPTVGTEYRCIYLFHNYIYTSLQ